jgi:SAM-dependent methyltransferase
LTDPPPVAFDEDQWRGVDEGWGRQAVEFATLAEPTNCREYVTIHHRLGVGAGDRLLDMACGSGLAVELAALRGARCAGIDASPRLIAVARDRSPAADLRVGDMNTLPWEDNTFDVVTSFRGIWGTTPHAVSEALRVLAPGGRIGLTVWGHVKASAGAWVFAPFLLADEPKVQNQAAMVALGRPGAGEALLADSGFAYEAIQAAGEQAFHATAVELGRQNVREGLPLRAPIDLVGFLATKPVPAAPRTRKKKKKKSGG